ncbi:MAG: inositol monophosphatase family protein [Roseovarius sp.]
MADFALSLARDAMPLALARFRRPMQIETKADDSPVTVADREIEALIRRRIGETFPDHGIHGEEEGAQNTGRRHVWVVDPIDGTRSFVSGMPTFGTLLAHLIEGRPVVGVIAIPATGEIWHGIAGQGAWFGAAPCRSSGCARLSRARLYATSPDLFDAPGRAAFERVSRRAAMRRFGGDCYAYGLLASGHVDAVVEMDLQPYDYLALVPVVEGAGGVISDWQGAPLRLGSSGHVVAAATPALHAEIMAHLAG